VELGILKLFAGMDASGHILAKGIHELLEIKNLHQAAVVIVLDFQKHRQARFRSMLLCRRASEGPPLQFGRGSGA
jgi:hypothetical protein